MLYRIISKLITVINTITFWYFKPISKWFRIDLLPSAVRWGTVGFMLTWTIFFLSFAGGGVMEWWAYAIGGFGLLLFVQLVIYFLTHPANNATERKIKNIV